MLFYNASLWAPLIIGFLNRTIDRLQPDVTWFTYERSHILTDYISTVISACPMRTFDVDTVNDFNCIDTTDPHKILIVLAVNSQAAFQIAESKFQPYCTRVQFVVVLDGRLDKRVVRGSTISQKNGVLASRGDGESGGNAIELFEWSTGFNDITYEVNFRITNESEMLYGRSIAAQKFRKDLRRVDDEDAHRRLLVQDCEVADPMYMLRLHSAPDGEVRALSLGVFAAKLVAEALNYKAFLNMHYTLNQGVIYVNSWDRVRPEIFAFTRNTDKPTIGIYMFKPGLDAQPFFSIDMSVFVPFELRDPNRSISKILAAAPIILVWLLSSILFTSLRVLFDAMTTKTTCGQSRASASPPVHSTFFHTFAHSLGTSMGPFRQESRSAKVISMCLFYFAILSSALFSGALYGQHFVEAPTQRINSIAELVASGMVCCVPQNIDIYERLGKRLANGSYQGKSIIAMRANMREKDTSCAYIFPDAVADLMMRADLRHPNHTPVYHRLPDKIQNIPFTLEIRPQLWQTRSNMIQKQINEGGLMIHAQRIQSAYISIIDPMAKPVEIPKNVAINNDLMIWLIYGFGMALGAFAFAAELFWMKWMWCGGTE